MSAAQTTGLVSTLGFVVGGVLLATGVTVLLTAPKAPDAAKVGSANARLTATWGAGPGGGNFALRGVF